MPPTIYVETPPDEVQLAGYSPDYNKWFLLSGGGSGDDDDAGGGAATGFLMAKEPTSGTCFWSARQFEFSHFYGNNCCWDYDFDASPYIYPVGFTPVASGYYVGKAVGSYLGRTVYEVKPPSLPLDVCPYPTVPPCDVSMPCDNLFEKYTLSVQNYECESCSGYYASNNPIIPYSSGNCVWTTGVYWCGNENYRPGEFVMDYDVSLYHVAPQPPTVPEGYWQLLFQFRTYGNFSYSSHMQFRCPDSEWDCLGANYFTFYSWSLTINPQCINAFEMIDNGIMVYPVR